MTLEIKHSFVTEKGDGQDPTLLQPSYWNDLHDITLAAGRLIGRTDTDGPAQEIDVDGLVLEGNTLRNPMAGQNGADTLIGTTPAVPDEAAPNARVTTDSNTVSWDTSIAKQIKANVRSDSITPAMLKSGAKGEILVYGEGGVAERLPPGVAGQTLVSGGPDAPVAWGVGGGAPHAYLRMQKAPGAHDVAPVADQWSNRNLNTEAFDILDFVTLGDFSDPAEESRFKLKVGWYVISWVAPVFGNVGKHQTRLRNVSDGITVPGGMGSSASCVSAGDTNSSIGLARFEVTDAAKRYAIQHRCLNAPANGFGQAVNFGEPEVYTQISIWKVG